MRGAFSADRWPLIERYAHLLVTEGVTRGLIGPREVPRLWTRHLANCAALADAVPAGPRSVADIGSGAGLPGLVLAIRRPELRVTLVEPLLRRTRFLEEVVSDLGLDTVEVVRCRAEELHGTRTFDVVTGRAVAPLPRLLGSSMPLVAPHGELLAMKGARAAEEVREAAEVVREWGCSPPTVHSVGKELIDPPTTVVRVDWADPDAVRWRSQQDPTAVGPSRRRSSRGRRGKR